MRRLFTFTTRELASNARTVIVMITATRADAARDWLLLRIFIMVNWDLSNQTWSEILRHLKVASLRNTVSFKIDLFSGWRESGLASILTMTAVSEELINCISLFVNVTFKILSGSDRPALG